ncbi:MAG: helix-turn-helix domain-containing protein [Akkermansia sp.]|nr:helix-turn-helix domain-containing protein [Akkermansia sp.]
MTNAEDQSQFKTEIKLWLKRHKLSYGWIAEQCGVSEITVRNWMSQKSIPPLKKQLLERVMEQMPTTPPTAAISGLPGIKVDACFSLTVQLTADLYNKLADKASLSGKTMEAMVAETIINLVTDEDSTLGAMRSRKVILPGPN